MMDWLPGAIVLPATRDGGPQDRSYPPRLVLHTTEGGGTVQSLAGFYHSSTYWPHFTADLVRKQLAQHIPFSRAGAALSHTTSTKTNGANCIQIEIIGRASESPGWPADQVDWFGRVLAPMLDALGIRRNAPAFVAAGGGFGAPQRMSEATWRAFNGVCGHEHVPENDHYDPGAFNIARFLAASAAHSIPVPPEDDVTPQDKAEIIDTILARLYTKLPNGQHAGLLVDALKVYLKPLEDAQTAEAAAVAKLPKA